MVYTGASFGGVQAPNLEGAEIGGLQACCCGSCLSAPPASMTTGLFWDRLILARGRHGPPNLIPKELQIST